MEFDFGWILLGLPLAFMLGWLASRFDLRQLRAENRAVPKAYFKGLNYLLNEQQDQAIDAFIEAVQNDPDTSELHFALGNLFRRRGEYDRAVRVHEHLLSRGDLDGKDRDRAQYALALDFLKAGLLDRAEAALLRLEGTAFEAQARLALLAIHERSRDWCQAMGIAQKMQAAGQGDFSTRQAHFLCEQAQALIDQEQWTEATAVLQQAMQIAPDAPRPWMMLAQLQLRLEQPQLALSTLMDLGRDVPQALPLAAPLLAQAAKASGREQQTLELLQTYYQELPSLDLLDSMVDLEVATGQSLAQGAMRYAHHLEKEPSLVAAAKWLSHETLGHPQWQPWVQRALEHAAQPLRRYRCAACGFEARQHFWQCPGCQSWDSYPARRIEEL
ncbi:MULTISPECIES: lipopolysaccharide assembly protein LapB [Giesbergeria]|uniref:Lipopolysaccharide assembly protein B n=1 Tax=Giesbergeria sinuosa TaxID=80883 RepID=A0ABV9QCB8_9BURK